MNEQEHLGESIGESQQEEMEKFEEQQQELENSLKEEVDRLDTLRTDRDAVDSADEQFTGDIGKWLDDYRAKGGSNEETCGDINIDIERQERKVTETEADLHEIRDRMDTLNKPHDGRSTGQ
ncbi:MAG: hypothetical protein ACQESR_03960 [Planctomycetota bacterium]